MCNHVCLVLFTNIDIYCSEYVIYSAVIEISFVIMAGFSVTR
jgi:hypothetical protein